MSFQIETIVLYGEGSRRREVRFRPGVVNVITGGSKTGKSALIDIVDYCLGASSSSVPDGVIREKVAWYGLRLQLASEQIFVARRAPPPGEKATSDVFFERGTLVEIPSDANALHSTTSVDALESLLSSAAGIAEYRHEPPAGQTRSAITASIRHALFFTFQQQDEIINKKALFHRQGEQFIPQTIKDVLPFFLGAVGDDFFARQGELRRAQEALRSRQRKLAEAEALRGAGLGRALSLLSEAQDAGLVVASGPPANLEEALARLRSVASKPIELETEEESSGEALDTLLEARKQLTMRLRRLKENLGAARGLVDEEKAFSREAHEQVARLRSVELFGGTKPGTHCPLCATPLEAQLPKVEELVRSVTVTSSQLESVAASAPHMQGLINRIEHEIDDVKRELAENREAIDAVEASREKLAGLRDHASRRAHAIGRVSLYLESVRVTDDASALRKALQEALDRVAELQQQLSGDSIAEKLQSIGSVLSTRMTEWALALQLEHSGSPHRIDFGKLTVVADKPDGVPLPMERMGSAETWVSCHLIAHLALHEWFAKRERPVPRFLFLDQPSEVYFPPDKDVGDGAFAETKDEDREAVRRMFKLVFEIAEAAGVQVVLTEHADLAEPWFQDAVIQRWRGNEKLVPIDW